MKDFAGESERLEISLADFVRTGVLGGLAVGQHRSEIRQVLGDPEELGRGMGKSVVESYAQRRLQLSFHRGRLILIAVYFRHEHMDSGDRIQLVWDLPSEGMTNEAALLEWLENADIPFRPGGSLPSDDWSSWVVEGGARVIFDEARLDSIQSDQGSNRDSELRYCV